MTKTAVITVRVDRETKEKAESLYASFGMTMADAVNMFIRQSLNAGGLHFEPRLPKYNKETEEAIEEARKIAGGKIKAKSYASYDEFMKELDD